MAQSRDFGKFVSELPKTPFCGNFDAKFGSSFGRIVSELPTIRPKQPNAHRSVV
jgi:hypothetical protein